MLLSQIQFTYGSNPGCANTNVNMRYLWSGGSYISCSWHINGVYVTAGTLFTYVHTISTTPRTVSAYHGSTGQLLQTITLQTTPYPEAPQFVTSTQNVCQGSNAILFGVSSTQYASSYIWTLPSGATGNSSTNNISVNFSNSANSGNISVAGVNACGNGGTSNQLPVTVSQSITPAFTQVSQICSGATLSALPTTSNNGIAGTWSPALNNTATTTYTFTPSIGQCATTAPMTIVVNPNVTPTFTPVSSICFGASITLPTTSLNGITGTWNPNVVNSSASTSYLFTPTAGQCATFATMGISVVPNAIPTFNTIAPICSGASLILPTISTNSITGTWFPPVNNTATTTYTFTPTVGQCAVPATLTVNVAAGLDFVNVQFPESATICEGNTVSIFGQVYEAGLTEPNSQASGIVAEYGVFTSNTDPSTWPASAWSAGTYNPIALLNPNNDEYSGTVSGLTAGTYYYAFRFSFNGCSFQYGGISAAGGGPWDGTANVNGVLTVNSAIIPTFTQVGPYTNGATIPALPTISTNNISGTWAPTINNTATTVYTFTPNTGQCGNATTMTIAINAPISYNLTASDSSVCAGTTVTLSVNIQTTNSVTDIDGNIYETVQIGSQIWMKENLRTTKYANGDVIPNVTDGNQWSNLTTGAWSCYSNNNQIQNLFGNLYNWFAVADQRNICPTGWHVPSDVEWITLTDYLGGESVAGGKMKSTAIYWQSPNQDATNESGFSGLPGGFRFQLWRFVLERRPKGRRNVCPLHKKLSISFK